ncbi:MAG: DUF3419 family protein [Bacteroidetes bacterium]|nr:DUF3419 family protein [Bacteroidota bacterium]
MIEEKTDFQLTEKVDFSFIRYANCWEDADILVTGLAAEKGDKILSIASAGDNSFSLLLNHPELVAAVDVNEVQLYLTHLKKTAIEKLEYEEVLSFLGFTASANRLRVYQLLSNDLPMEVRSYFNTQTAEIESGIIHHGKFEKYFQKFSQSLLPFIHSQKTVQKLLEPKSAEAQKEFFKNKWNTWRWRLLFRIFFSKWLMGKLGRDPEFLKEVKINVGEFILGKAAEELSSTRVFNNFILQYNLNGNYGKMLPPYLRKENFSIIKSNINQVQIVKGFAQDATAKFGKFNRMNLSNIFEYMNPAVFAEVGKSLADGLEKNGRVGYWNLMVPRKLHEALPESFSYNQEISEELSAIDKGFFYNCFIVAEKL